MFAIFPEILQLAEKGELEGLSCLVRKYFAEQQVFTPNIHLAELCGNAEIKIDNAVQKIAARLEAWDAKGQFRIIVSIHPDIKSVREQNYILAQMLGHVFLDLQPKMAKGELQRTIFEKKTSPLRALLREPAMASQVDDFACALLLPKGMVKKAMSTLALRKDVAAFFNVELALLDHRLEQLALLAGAKPVEVTLRPAAAKAEPRASVKAEATKDKAAGAAGVAHPGPDLSSLARVNRSVAARTYKKEGERPAASNSTSPSPGLERLRQLARKIDKSVE